MASGRIAFEKGLAPRPRYSSCELELHIYPI